MNRSTYLFIVITGISHFTLVAVVPIAWNKNHHLHLNSIVGNSSRHHKHGHPVHQSQRRKNHHITKGFPAFPSGPTFPSSQSHPFSHSDQLQFAQEALIAHNKYRKLHSVPPLKLDPQLIHDAYIWAQKNVADCDRMNKFVLTHSHKHDRGENIFAATGVLRIMGHTPVDQWYNEIQYYNWNKPGFQYETGHFSQVIWKHSRRMGIAWAKGKNGFIVAVAHYHPTGNIINSFKSNVLPALR